MKISGGTKALIAYLAAGVSFVLMLNGLLPAGRAFPNKPTGYDDSLPEIVIRAEVTNIRFPEVGDVVDVLGSPDFRYIVRLRKKSVVKGRLSESWLTVTVHSPSQELQGKAIGEIIVVGLDPIGAEPVLAAQSPGRWLPDVSRVKYRLSMLPNLPLSRINQAVTHPDSSPPHIDPYPDPK